MTTIQETRLPNGMNIFCLREAEVPVLYGQIQEYFKHGISLREGDTVFDVGANIGLFALWSYQSCHRNLQVYAFEPIPTVFEALKANSERFGSDKIKVFSCGLSKQAGTFEFAYFPNSTMLSTSHRNDIEELKEQFRQSAFRNPDYLPTSAIARWFFRRIPTALQSFFLNRELAKAFEVEQITCQLRTISEIIQEQAITAIDLLKVDVEKSELDVLLGIEPDDWPKVKQVVVEIHDLDNRLETIKRLLTDYGFQQIKVEQEGFFEGSNIFNIYAIR